MHTDALPGQRINAVNGLEDSKLLANGGRDILPSCRRCLHCNGGGAVNEVALPDRTVLLHRECEAPWMERETT